MRAIVLTLLLALPLSAAVAQEAGGRTCASVISNADKGGADTIIAVSTYFHGVFLGRPCVEVDYDRSYALAQSIGLSYEPWANVLRVRAADGHPTAIAALKRLGL